MSFTIAYDVTASNYGNQPEGETELYVTGTPDIVATPEMRAAHPDAVLIDQTPAEGQWDATADVDDYENGAVSLAELAPRAHERLASFQLGKRNGQREPAIYMSQSNVTPVVNALIAGGLAKGVNLLVANWNLSEPEAAARVAAASGPFPIIGIQFENAGAFDVNVLSTSWLNNRSGGPPKSPAPVAVPPGQWNNPKTWVWKTATITGTGLDGKQHSFDYDEAKNQWVRLS